MLNKTPFAILFVLALCISSFPQDVVNKNPAQAAHARCKFSNEGKIAVDYFTMRAEGHKIFGGLVPFGEVWRSANEETTLVTDEDLVTVSGANIPAGSYTILIIPNPNKWTLIINKNTVYDSGELVRVPMSVKKLSAPVENFTISFDHGAGSCTMRISWENTQASLEFAMTNADLPIQRFDAVHPPK